ncbi:hypothetical protein Dsin_026958 [Dipteronia sinensis]|uniref:TF-B3 domain-containing protein n=1 Tax=Dipteronia sinensis TaxID=43782 RepID=A0AAE0DYI4_9ROSI|nr:hypothetical protein Dsin_026958 [Dipteronia sinensis]
MAFSRRTDPSSSTSLTEKPHFFKVILPATIEEKKMRIPEKFVRKFGDELSDVATMRLPNGHVWHVKLVKDGKEIWFHDGLHDFVKYHSICAGHFLVFKYEKNSNFHVLLFDTTACEVQYPDYCEELNDEKNSVRRDEMKTDNSVEIMGRRTPNPSLRSLRRTYRCVECGASLESKTTRHLNDPDSSTQNEHEEEVCRFSGSSSATTEERERAIEAAKAFEPANPFCSVVMRSTYVQKWCIMFLPACFSAEHLKGVSGFIKLQFSDGKQWPIHCQYGRRRAKLGEGWYEFTLENNLGEGDVCVFEVLRSRDIVLKVTVFRVLESAESVNRVSFFSALGKNRCRKCVAYLETTPKHVYDPRSKRCKIEAVERIDNSDVVGDVSELRKTANKVAMHYSDAKNKSKYDDDEVLALLKDKGISVKQNFRKIAAEAKERAINIVRFLKPKNPSFMIIFQSRSQDKYSLYLPAEFASKYFSRDAKIIKLQVSDGREWPVQLCWRHNEAVDFITGWTTFSKENNLEEGDVCLFELIRMEDILLKVSVFHSCV